MDTPTTRKFLDIRNHDFVRMAVVIPKVSIGNPKANAHAHFDSLKEVYEKGSYYALCPELGITGYTCSDLFHSQELLYAALKSLDDLIGLTNGWNMLITIGIPLLVNDSVYNCAVTFYKGKILAVVPKSYLPGYREFYEPRHFACAHDARFDTIDLPKNNAVPFGTHILILSKRYPMFVLHNDICEDIWVPIPPGTKAALHGATVLANLSASNITVGKADYRTELVIASSGRNNAVQMYSAAGFGESTTDHAWDGQGIIAERGTLLKTTERFAMHGTHIVQDVDLGSLTAERMRQNSFRSNANDNDMKFRQITFDDSEGLESQKDIEQKSHSVFERDIDPLPFIPRDPHKRDERCYEVFKIQATSLARRLEAVKDKKIKLGISGGLDSTHALLVAVHAFDLLEIPRTDITAITMPGFGTTNATRKNAIDLSRALGVALEEISIIPLCETMFRGIQYNSDEEPKGLTFENVQAWSRTFTLLAQSAHTGGIVLGTGDLSELLLGWCTYMGDHGSHYAINAGVPKTLIQFVIDWSRTSIFKQEEEVQAILGRILKTDISPELLPHVNGKIAQKTEEIIGPYELHDFFGYYFVRFGFRVEKIARMALHAFGGKYAIGEIKKWLKIFVERFFRNQFKRSFLPDGPKVGLACVSPRGDWRMPSDMHPDMWLEAMDAIPYSLE